MIDLEFYGGGRKEKRVREIWKQYCDHLHTRFDQNATSAWIMRRDEIFVELLYSMANCLGFDFDKTHIKNSSYSPMAHEDLELEQNMIRAGIIKILSGKSEFPIPIIARVATSDDEAQEQVVLRKALLAYLG